MSTSSYDSGPPDEDQIQSLRSLAETLRGQFENIVEKGPKLAREARDLSITESSSDGLVKVTVDSRGGLLALDLDPRIYRRPDARSLADTILDTVRAATQAAQERVLDIFEPIVGREEMRLYVQGTPEDVIENVEDKLNRRAGL